MRVNRKLSKLGKRFAFVRYIKVNDVTHIIDGIRNTWIGSHKLCANMARFDRKVEDKSTIHSKPQVSGLSGRVKSNTPMTYANVIQRKKEDINETRHQKDSVIRLDGDCLKDIETSVTIFACVKEFRALMNMRTICFWIAIEFQSTDSCKKFKDHAGIKSWFSSIRKASKDFFIRDRVAWIDVEGVPFQAFTKIASIWGELIYTVNSKGSNMYS
ncbi:hypothetical protein Tco_1348235, partial [Tanacetum coccineum]